jgi:tetratricopeptide (TPR) repeat protein
MAVTAGKDGRARTWQLPPLVKGSVPHVALWLKVVTGRGLDDNRVVRVLPSQEWARAAQQLAEVGAPKALFEALAWHHREARSCEAMGQWFAAAWHLGRVIEAAPDPHLYSRRGWAYLEMGQTERAIADYSQAIDAKDSALARFERGRAYLLARDWERAVEDLGQAIKRDRGFGPAWHHRGYAHAALAQWKAAADDLAEAVKRSGVSTEALSHQALICLHLHDTEGYRKACQMLFLRHSEPRPGSGGRAHAAWICAVGPDSRANPRKWLAWGSIVDAMSAKPVEQHFVHRAVGAVLYRWGDCEESIRKLHQALDAARRSGQDGTPTAWVLLAMAEHRRKDQVKAREWLDKARAWMASARKPAADGGDALWNRMPWPERLALELLHGEASKLIEGEPKR